MKPLILAIVLATLGIIINYTLVAIDGSKPTPHQEEIRKRSEYYKAHSNSMKGYE